MEKIIIGNYDKANCIGILHKDNTNTAKGTILIACAMGITQKYYQNLAKFFNQEGFNVLTFDYRGTGLSSPKNLKGYTIDLFDWANDINDAIAYLDKNHKGDLYYIGHSIGGQLLGFASNNKLLKKALFLASSFGYWRQIQGTEKWSSWFKLKLVMPFVNFIWGYTNAKTLGLGESYPKKAAMQWRKWCFSPSYLEMDLTKENNFFKSITQDITSFIFSDDSIANEISSNRLLNLYEEATRELKIIKPEDFQMNKIGHAGFLSRKFKNNLWPKLLNSLN